MKFDIILAGVGGQGILTTAQAICLSALRRNWHVKQAELHGMSQRGGAVQSHLRIGDREIFSDLIPLGSADMILAMEPLESLRYLQYLGESGTLVVNSAAVVNIANYGAPESVLNRIFQHPRHVLIDANRLAGLAGSSRSVNMVMFGAAASFIGLTDEDCKISINELFGGKEKSIVDVSIRAFELGRAAAGCYQRAIMRGASAQDVHQWLSTLDPHELGKTSVEESFITQVDEEIELRPAQVHTIDQILRRAEKQNRVQLFEHEVYSLLETAGAITPPQHSLVRDASAISPALLAHYQSDKVVIKVVSPKIVHKSDGGFVAFVANDPDAIARRADELVARARTHTSNIEGLLISEFVDHGTDGFGSELFVGIRSTREFGPVLAAGLGGVDTEFFASKLKPGSAVAKALALDTSPAEFLELFKKTAAYDLLTGRARSHNRLASDGELLRCFRTFLAIARRFCVNRADSGPEIIELEVNPFAFRAQRMIPLDGRGRLGRIQMARPVRPAVHIETMLEPKSIAVLGASGTRRNFGRIILENIKACGFPQDRLFVIHPGAKSIAGISCVSSMSVAPMNIDLLILACSASDAPEFVREAIDSGKVSSVIVIPGGIGEKVGTENLQCQIQQYIAGVRTDANRGPVLLGGNCLGVRSKPGHYDTFFVEQNKLETKRDSAFRPIALISQSGGFLVSLLSNLKRLDPAFAISVGNQMDLTVGDMMNAVQQRDDISVIAVYVEGFSDWDGRAFCHAMQSASEHGKTVIFYKAGRTESGRAAAAGHTASLAGDYDVCQAVAEHAGAIVTDTFKEFEQVLELAATFEHKKVRGTRIAALSNAGFEAVGMADAIQGARYKLQLANLTTATMQRISSVLKGAKLDALVNLSNPMDLTPMANDEVFEKCIRAALDDDQVDALIVSIVPATPQLHTTADELNDPNGLAVRLPVISREYDKPVLAVVEAGPIYEPFVERIRDGGVPVFCACDQAVRSLGRYLSHGVHRNAQNTNTPDSTRFPIATAMSI